MSKTIAFTFATMIVLMTFGFSANAQTLDQSIFIGKSIVSESSITVDSKGNVFVLSATTSPTLPNTNGSAKPTINANMRDAFITKLDPDLKVIKSTYLGTGSFLYNMRVTTDQSDNIYVAGITNSENLANTNGSIQSKYGGGYLDAFVMKISPDLTTIIKTTYFGGPGTDTINSIIIDSLGFVYITGTTDWTDMPNTNDGQYGGNGDVFMAKFNSDLTEIIATTYLGGSLEDESNAIALDSRDNVYVAGITKSKDIPVLCNLRDP